MSDSSGRELLDAVRIRAELSRSALGWLNELEVHARLDSTNTHLVRFAEANEIDGHVCLAEQQTAGRGRRGRTWLSPGGRNIALSLGRSLAVPGERLGSLSLVVGLAVADAVGSLGAHSVRLKWPNDVLLDNGKLGGILIELVQVGVESTVVIGVGLNVGGADQVRGEVDQPIADLTDEIREVSRNSVAARLINTIHDYASQFERVGFGPMREAWLKLHAYQGREVRVVIGERSVHGLVNGISDKGELELETDSGMKRFSAGEVSLRDP